MDFLSSLNPSQNAAVLHTDGPLLILAGAGSGKTRVIVSRIAHLIATGRARPDQVLAVTFTNKAAEEMRNRVEQLVGEDCRQVWLSTFHALSARLLRREAPAIGLSRDFVIYDSSDQIAVVKQALKSLDLDEKMLQPRAALARISQAKNRMETPENMRASGWSLRDQQISQVYDVYRRTLGDAGALDFDDLLLKTVELMETSERAREYLRAQVPVRPRRRVPGHQPPAVPADQAAGGSPPQPLRRGRSRPVDLPLARRGPAQHPRLRARLSRRARRPARAELPLDAGDSRRRLRASSGQNRNRKDKRLWTEHQGGELVLYVRAGDEIEEADFITRSDPRSADGGRRSSTAAVLYRTNAQSRAIEDALMREGVAYRIIGGVRFYERKEIKDALAYLRLLINPHDDVSFRRVVNVPARGIGKSVLEALDAIEVGAGADHADMPLLSAGLQPAPIAAIALGAACSSRSSARNCRLARWPHSRRFAISSSRWRRMRPGAESRRRSAGCWIAPAICRTCATSAARRPRAASRT